MSAPLLALSHISKRYPAVLANDAIDLNVMPQQIHAILGENGAGKSTLMKIIYGAVQPDAGSIHFDGKPVQIRNPQQARALGISMVFQHFSLFDTLSVAQNVWLGLDKSLSLAEVSQRIRDSLRPHDVVARLGGDEFGVLVRHVEHERCVVGLAERLMEAMRQPFVVGGTELMTSASIGITFSALGYANPEDVLRDADTAMHKAKAAGKARYALFDTSLHTEVADRLRLEGELRHAIDDGRLSVAYQPVFDLRGGAGQGGTPRLAGFEALVRWQHPVDGSISPGAFLPIAEEAGLMVRLTDFVLHCACRQLHEWQQRGPAWASLTMNVNLSGHDIAHPALVARVMRALVEAEVRPDRLCLELTENILMSRLEGALPALKELRRMGVVLAIDDFGTGYSSLAYLNRFPITKLKIDRSFVHDMLEDPSDRAITLAIIGLGHTLGLKVVAEGVERPREAALLREARCDELQGYLFGKPMPADALPRWMASQVAELPA